MNPRPPCRSALAWLQAHKGRECFVAFTAQDRAALETFAHAVALYGFSDSAGRQGAVDAMRGAVAAMQRQHRHMARDLIPAILDWGSILEIWPLVSTEVRLVDSGSPSEHADQLCRRAPPAAPSERRSG